MNLLRIALELARRQKVYEDIATKFFEHFLVHRRRHLTNCGEEDDLGLWDEQDEFISTINCCTAQRPRDSLYKIQSMVGLIPLFAVETLEPEVDAGTS